MKKTRIDRLTLGLIVFSLTILGLALRIPKTQADLTVNYSVAIVPYVMKSAETQNLGAEVNGMIIKGFTNQGFRTIDEMTAAMAAQAAGLDTETVAYEAAVAQIAQRTGARVVITGEFSVPPNKGHWYFLSKITDTESGQTVINQFVYPLNETYKDAPPKVASMIAEYMEKKLHLPIPDGAGL